ncbi:MAG: archaemetzincin family Zn-dependent metalloprotease [Candidatus Aminicenantes bacterium]|nr:archaemetzincin family Zn-dependent metalloprotease [Candidatus Aminicenantes bacterium]
MSGSISIKKIKINLIPVGQVKKINFDFLIEFLADSFRANIQVGNNFPLPGEAFNFQRKQYLSSYILRTAKSYLNLKEDEKALLIADVDLYAEGLNFVFGEAEINGSIAIISLVRLRESFYGRPEKKEIFESRVKKEAVHELGHVFGLKHCSSSQCVMYFSNSLADTDRKSWEFCLRCRGLLMTR